MTASAVTATAPPDPLSPASDGAAQDHRGSWVPNRAMIATRIMELRKRRGLMIALVFVNIGIPTVFLVVRLLAHAFAPHSYGPAGGYDIFSNLVAGVMFIFGFIVAATLGCTAGSVDLSEGMFRHLVVTGRSRLALYLARIPAGLAIIVPLVAVGFTIVCAVCVFAAPTQLELPGRHGAARALPLGLRCVGRQPRRRGDLRLQLRRIDDGRRPRVATDPASVRVPQRISGGHRAEPSPSPPHRRPTGPRPSRWPTRTTRTTRATSSRRRSR